MRTGENVAFSVIIPVYNRADEIAATLQSVWDQTLRDLEVIVVDDGSTDHLSEVLSSIDDPRLRSIRIENSGPAAARNAGVAVAQGRFIAYLDSDDKFLPHHLSSMHSVLGSGEIKAAFAPVIVDRGVGRYTLRPTRPMREGESFGDYRFLSGEPVLLDTLVVATETARQVSWDESLFFGDVDQYVHDLLLVTGTLPLLRSAGAVYNDVVGRPRLSQLFDSDKASKKYTNFLYWVDSNAASFSDKALAAHQARNAAVTQQTARGTLRVIRVGYQAGALSLSDSIRQLIRARWPAAYRMLIDRLLAYRGDTFDEVLSAVRTPNIADVDAPEINLTLDEVPTGSSIDEVSSQHNHCAH